jgi:hypothetical protein
LLWLLPPVLWLWSNVHLQFVYGLALIGAFALEPLLNRVFRSEVEYPGPRNQWLWLALGASTLVTLINPYSYGVWWVIWDFVKQPKQYRYVLEFHSMAFDMNLHFMVLFITLVAAVCLGRARKIQPLWMLLLFWSATLGFHAERDIWVVTMICLVIIGNRIAEVGRTSTEVQPRVWLAAALVLVAFITFRIKTGPTNNMLLAHVATVMPVGAVAYIHEHHLQGPIFNNFDWGGFLIYSLPEFPVAMDGRTNVHDQDEIERSLNTFDGRPSWRDDPLLAKANLVIVAPKFALASILALDPEFRIVFEDGTSVLFQRVATQNSRVTR